MDIKLESLIPYDALQTNMEVVFSVVEKNGKAVLLRDNKPTYLIMKYGESHAGETGSAARDVPGHTLHEAMMMVLSEAEDKTMHAKELADEIYRRGLYLKKDGSKANYIQVRARCGHYSHLFETLPGNYIKLKEHAGNEQ